MVKPVLNIVKTPFYTLRRTPWRICRHREEKNTEVQHSLDVTECALQLEVLRSTVTAMPSMQYRIPPSLDRCRLCRARPWVRRGGRDQANRS